MGRYPHVPSEPLPYQRHAKRTIATDAYLVEHDRLTSRLDSIDSTSRQTDALVVDSERALGWLKDMRRLWRSLDDAGRRDLANALYERVTVTSEGIVEVELTQEALQHGAALALPERVVLARPEGSEHALPTLAIEGLPELVEFLRAA